MQSAKRLQKAILVVLAIIIAVIVNLYIPRASAEAKGNEGKGKYYFKQNCKECHTKGAVGGEITPLSRTQAQWKTYFVKGKHNGRIEPLSKFMGDEQLRDVETFLYNHAADSLQPQTCGK